MIDFLIQYKHYIIYAILVISIIKLFSGSRFDRDYIDRLEIDKKKLRVEIQKSNKKINEYALEINELDEDIQKYSLAIDKLNTRVRNLNQFHDERIENIVDTPDHELDSIITRFINR